MSLRSFSSTDTIPDNYQMTEEELSYMFDDSVIGRLAREQASHKHHYVTYSWEGSGKLIPPIPDEQILYNLRKEPYISPGMTVDQARAQFMKYIVPAISKLKTWSSGAWLLARLIAKANLNGLISNRVYDRLMNSMWKKHDVDFDNPTRELVEWWCGVPAEEAYKGEFKVNREVQLPEDELQLQKIVTQERDKARRFEHHPYIELGLSCHTGESLSDRLGVAHQKSTGLRWLQEAWDNYDPFNDRVPIEMETTISELAAYGLVDDDTFNLWYLRSRRMSAIARSAIMHDA